MKAVLTMLNTAFLTISWSQFKLRQITTIVISFLPLNSSSDVADMENAVTPQFEPVLQLTAMHDQNS